MVHTSSRSVIVSNPDLTKMKQYILLKTAGIRTQSVDFHPEVTRVAA
jgi:hypothetical protein